MVEDSLVTEESSVHLQRYRVESCITARDDSRARMLSERFVE